MAEEQIIAKNKRAAFEYFLEDHWTAGIQLTGTEIKSIRNHKARITEAYCLLQGGELYVRNMTIDIYENGGHYNHEPRRDRKLLLNAHEIKKLEKKLKNVGNTCVPTALIITKEGYAKLKIALATGKKMHDKRDDLKTKDAKRQIERGKSERY
jgi:SsrA-binding protein